MFSSVYKIICPHENIVINKHKQKLKHELILLHIQLIYYTSC